ncbi:hypothetical protein ACP70R_041126 [Stipagrostis hirtigluma subsp. patula]
MTHATFSGGGHTRPRWPWPCSAAARTPSLAAAPSADALLGGLGDGPAAPAAALRGPSTTVSTAPLAPALRGPLRDVLDGGPAVALHGRAIRDGFQG